MRRKFLLMTFLTLLFTAMGTSVLRAQGNVAKVGNTEYAKLADAVNAAQADDEIKVIANIATNLDLTISKKVTLDLGGFTLSDAGIIIASDVTIKNGKIVNTNESYPLKVTGSGNLTVDGVAIEASKSDRAIWLDGSSSVLNFKSGSSILATKGTNNTKSTIYGVWVAKGATANIYGGTITVDAGADATAVAIFGNYVNTVNIYGGKISTSGKYYSYAVWVDGDVTITGGEIVTNEKQYGYSSGITYGYNYAINSKGNVEISGDTKITTYGPKGYIVNAGGSNQEVVITGGEFTNVLSEVDKTAGGHSAPNLIYGSSVDATIEGGDFNGYKGEELIKGTGSTLTITGGSFDNKPKDDYVEVGATITVGETTYTKTEDGLEVVIPVASVNGTSYTDLQEAIKAAAPSGTVEILSDVTVDEWIMFSETLNIGSGQIITMNINGLTINGNDKTVTINSIESAGNGGYLIFDATKLNVKDLTIKYADGLVGGIGLKSGTINNVTFIGGNYGVFPGASGVTIENCKFNGTKSSAVYYEEGRQGIVVKNNSFNTADGAYAITMRSNEQFTGNTITKGKVNIANSSSATVTGNNFGQERFKVYNAATATIEDNEINVLAFNDESVVFSTFEENTLSTDAQTVLDAASFPVAQIGTTKYGTLAEALSAASAMTGDVTVEIYEKVTLNQPLAGSYSLIKFVGKDTDAEIYLDVQGYITATGKEVAFEGLTLSKSLGGHITNAGFMNVAFGVYDVTKVTYTNCTFANGAYASSGNVTYTGCTFKRSHDKYGLWAYGNVDVTVNGCIFADYRGIKMYAEGAAKTVDLTVKNTNFSAVNDKPAIVLTYGEKVTLQGNTYSSTGTFELDLDGAPNGTTVTSDVDPICINDNGACGVLCDGKIYTTVAQAAEVATPGSTVTLLHDSAETVVLPMGVILDKNGHEAAGVTVAEPIAKIGEVGYTSLAEAVADVQEGQTIQLLAGEISEGTIKLPATLKNVTFIGAADHASVLKDMTITAADGNSFNYEGLTFDGIYFYNSRISLTGWRNGDETIKDLTVTNCWFKNLDDTSNSAPLHINKDAYEAVNGLTFTNNVIDGATGGSKSGVYAQTTGEVVFTGNIINNVSFRPYIIQLTTDDGVADTFTVTGNTFSGSAAGRAQGLGNNAEGTDAVSLTISNNIFKDITNAQQICYWNFNEAKTTAVLEKNYYDIDIVANPGMIYFNNPAADKYELSEMGVFPIYRELNEDGTINTASAYTPELPIAQIGETGYATLAEAAAEATEGETITMLADAAEDVTIPAGVSFNGNGKAVGNIIAAGTITFNGHTKATSFNVENTNTTVNIVEGACLEITGTGRMVIGHGCIFNITGTITDAKTANVADLTPSLIMPGASFTGAGVTFNVTNAYIKTISSYCSSKNSSANSTFDFNIENSIWEQYGSLVFSEPTNGMDPTVNFELRNSVLNSTSHLVFSVTKGEVVIDNSNVNVGNRRQIENRSTMIVKNGSVVNGAVATSSNAKNPGTLIVDNATYDVTGEFSGSNLGTGTLIVNKTANFSAGSITKANIQIDATGMSAGDQVNITADLASLAGTIEVINNNMLDAKIVGGKIVLVEKPVAKIGDVEYTTLEDAFKAATSGCTIEILENVTVDYAWDNRYTGSKFTVPVTINGNDKTIKFTASVNDNNYQAPFRFQAHAAVNNLIIDMSEVTDNRFRAISSNANLTVNGCKFIGKDKTLNCRAIIFGEGAGTNVGNLEISITDCNFVNWRRGITDNENGDDVKNVTITGNTLTNSAVYVSAYNNVTFTGNTVTDAYVNIKSYTADNKLKVTATDNYLTANTVTTYNSIDAGGVVVAQEGFVVAPKGDKPIAYVSETTIWGQTWANAKESYVIKVLNEGNEVMGTSALNTSLDVTMDGDVEVTWHITLPGITDDDQYWIQEWTTDPSIYNMPAKVALWVDGVEVNEGPVKLNGPDEINKIYAAVTDEDGKIYSYHTSIADAITAINNTRSVTPNVIALLRDTDETVTLPAGIKLNLNGFTADNVSVPVAQIGETPYYTLAEAVAAAQDKDVIEIIKEGNYTLPEFAGKELTFKGSSRTGTSITDWVNQASQGMMGSTVHFENLTISGQTENYYGLFHTNAVTYKDCNINGLRFLYSPTTFEKCAFNAEGVEHSFWTYGASNVTVTDCTFTYTDRAVNCYSENGANHELDITFTGCTFTYANTNATSEGAVEINSGSVKSIDLVMNECTAPENGEMWFISQWDSKHGANTLVIVDEVVVWIAPAKIGETKYATLQEALDAAAAGTGNITVEILDDINLTNVDWNPVTVSAPGYPVVTVEGNGKTITGLNDMLFAGTWAGNSGLIIKNLTIKESNIVHDENDTAGTIGVGAFIGYPQASATITLNNCHLVNSTVNGGHWTGGLIGMAGGYNGNDGPVFMNLTIAGCSVTNSIITGKGSCGGIIGHGSCAAWTAVNIQNTTVSGNTVTSTGSSTNKAGAIMGTIGAAGQPTTANGVTMTGGAMVAAIVSDNTVTSGGTAITTIYGRQGTDTGILELNGGSYDNYPIEQNVAYAKPAAGLMIELNDNGTYGLVEDPAYGKVAMIGETYYETLSAAFAAVTNDEQTVVILSDVTEKLEGAYLRGNITTKDGTKVTITLTNENWVYCPYTFILGENITLNVPALFYYAGGAQINGTVVAGAYYQRYANSKLTINEPGSMKVTTETFIVRYMDGDPNAGIYIIGDNNDETIGLDASVIYFYQGMINAKDADIKVGTYWQTNETDNVGSANLVLDNSNMTVTVNEHNMKATANSTVTLTNGSNVTVAGGYQGVGVSIDATSSMTMARSIFVSKINNYHYTSLQEAVNVGGEVTVLQDITLTEGIVIPADKTVTLDLAGCTVKQEKAQTTGYAMITNVGTLTIKDSSNPSTGKLSYKDTGDGGDGSFASNTIQNHGHLTILGGRIENLSEGQVVEVGYPHAIDHGNYSKVYTVGDVTLDIQGGTISNAHYSAIRMFCNSTTYRCDATISGGTIENAIDFQLPNAGKLLGSLTITGGTFNNINGKTTSVRMFAAGNANDGTGMIASIEGGTFNGTVGVITQLPVPGSFNTKVIKGGKFSATAAQNTSVDLLAEGFAFNDTPDANGYYTVIQTAGTQTRDLVAGWSWFSTYVDIELADLQTKLGNNGVQIKGQEGYTQYYSGLNAWSPGLSSISPVKMYMIKTNDAQSISLEGDFVAEDRPITLNPGWNWIGYPVRESVALLDAINNITPSAGDVIKSHLITAYYQWEQWIIEINSYGDFIMTPGEGYMYYSNSDESYTFTYSKGTGTPSRTASEPIEKHWIADATQYANNMTMIAMLSIDGEIVKGDYEIAAFANGECRGSARPIYIEAIDSYVLIMTINGEEVEELSFKYYDVNNGSEYELSNRVNYSNDAILGTAEEPYMLTLDITGVDEASISEINIYPNPTTIGSAINLQATCDKVEVFNALGVKIAEYQNVDSIDALETAGIYVIRVTDNNEVKHCRLVVK